MNIFRNRPNSGGRHPQNLIYSERALEGDMSGSGFSGTAEYTVAPAIGSAAVAGSPMVGGFYGPKATEFGRAMRSEEATPMAGCGQPSAMPDCVLLSAFVGKKTRLGAVRERRCWRRAYPSCVPHPDARGWLPGGVYGARRPMQHGAATRPESACWSTRQCRASSPGTTCPCKDPDSARPSPLRESNRRRGDVRWGRTGR